MDEVLDVLDGLEAVTSLGDLAEASVDIADVAAAVGLDFDAGLMDVLLEDPFGALDQIPDGVDVLAEMDRPFAEWTDRMLVELPNGELVQLIVPTPENLPELLGDAMGAYHAELLDNLSAISLDAQDLGDGVLGCWQQTAEGAQIVLDPAHGDVWATANHEVGHHIFENHPALKESMLAVLKEEGYLESRATFLGAYASDVQPAEACAEALAQFRSNAVAFAHEFPRAAALLDQLLVP
jgi:hypothetical protein